MIKRAVARACSNIALCKYWGKLGPGNAPATPSISLALADLWVEYTAEAAPGRKDRFLVDGRPPDPQTRRRLEAYLCYWRQAGMLSEPLQLASRSSFPIQAGLASSAAAYAALAGALAGLAGMRLPQGGLTRWARLGSGSAARSVVGGLAALPSGMDPQARRLAAPGDIPWGMVVALVAAPAKLVTSRVGMELSRVMSPYYAAWVKQAAADYRRMLAALKLWDLAAVGEVMEENTLAMHACIISTRPAPLYWAPATIGLLNEVRHWRERGLAAYATVDAGAHVALLARREDLGRVARAAAKMPGVVKVITSLPGGPVQVEVQ